MEADLTFDQLLDLLTELVDTHKSGTLFIRSACNHVITIGLDKGRINALFYGAKRGQNALHLINQISSGSYKFETNNLVGVNQELPSTSEILNLLRAGSIGSPATELTSAPEQKPVGISKEKRDRLCRQLKELLNEYLGPIAQMVVDDALATSGEFYATPKQAQDFIDELAMDIDNANEVEAFRNKAYEVFDRVLFG